MMPSCSIQGCEDAVLARALCRRHYQRLRRKERGQQARPLDAPDTYFRRPAGTSCTVDGCDRPHLSHDLCDLHLQRFKKIRAGIVSTPVSAPIAKSPRGQVDKINKDGYHLISVPAGTPGAVQRGLVMLEHRYVMQNHLRRPLLRAETVHHKDGNRLNNNLDNLELKSGNHGSGINVIDGVLASLDWIERYSGLDLAERAMLATIRDKAERALLGEIGPAKRRTRK
jgi:hypothetical protein